MKIRLALFIHRNASAVVKGWLILGTDLTNRRSPQSSAATVRQE